MSFFSSRVGVRGLSNAVMPDIYRANVTMLISAENLIGDYLFDTFSGNILSYAGEGSVSRTDAKQKFGRYSLDFPGTGLGIYSEWGTGNTLNSNFTWECWVNIRSFTHNLGSYMAFLDNRNANGKGYFVGCNNSGQVYVFNENGSIITGSHSLSLNTWYHIALTRSSNVLKVWVNGQESGSSSRPGDDTIRSDSFYIGMSPDGYNDLNGYMDEIRITEGVARYTSTFPVPFAKFERVVQGTVKVKGRGGFIYTSGDYKTHVFKYGGLFNYTVSDATTPVSYLLVGGGKDGFTGETRNCNYNGGAGGTGGDGGLYVMQDSSANLQFQNVFGTSTDNFATITVAAANSDLSQIAVNGGSTWDNNEAFANGGGAGGNGGTVAGGTNGGNGSASSINWVTGMTIYYSASGGGGGGGSYNVSGNEGGATTGGNGGNYGGGNGGAGAAANGNNPGNGANGTSAYTVGFSSNTYESFGGGGGGGGGASGEPQCAGDYTGGDGGAGTAGVVIIHYKYK